MTIQAGDNQAAEPGAFVPLEPVVLIRDAEGRGVPGVHVSFSVDSGGGSLTSTSGTTTANGTTSPGAWRLGAAEGRNVVSASVSGLRLKLVATAQITPVTLPEQTVGPKGGTVVMVRPGSPIDGLSLVIPDGAFTGDQVIEVSYRSSIGFVHPAGTTVITPTVTLRMSDASYAKRALSLTVPAKVPAGTFPVLVLRDAATGRSDVMLTTGFTPTSVTAVTGHFNGEKLMGADGSFGPRVLADLQNPAAEVTVTGLALPTALLDQVHDTGFDRLTDQWDFPAYNTVITDATDLGWAGTAGWYYTTQRQARGHLFTRYLDGMVVPFANRRGLRWVSVAQRDTYRPMNAVLLPLLQQFNEAQNLAGMTSNTWNSIRSSFVLLPHSPQVALLVRSAPQLQVISAVLVFKSGNSQLSVIDPAEDPRQTRTLSFLADGSLVPMTWPSAGVTVNHLLGPGLSLFADISQLGPQFSKVLASTIGQAEFPTYETMMAWGDGPGEFAPLTDPLYLFDEANPIRVWTECVTCSGFSRPGTIPAGSALVGVLDFFSQGSGGAVQHSGTGKVSTSFLAAPGEATFGIAVHAHNTDDPNPETWDWLDWVQYTGKRLAASLGPDPIKGEPGVDTPMNFNVTGAPAGLEYFWDFDDGQTVVTTTPGTAHVWTTAGDYTVRVTARVPSTKQPVAKASALATVRPALPVWKFTTVSLQFTKAGPGAAFNLDDHWRTDSARLTRIRDGGTQGAMYLVEQAFTRTCTACNELTLVEGIYLLEGQEISTATMANPPVVFQRGASPSLGSFPTAPRVNGWHVVETIPLPGFDSSPFCRTPAERFQRTGTAVNGHVTGYIVHNCQAVAPFESVHSKEADVTINGDAMTGTITGVYRRFLSDGTLNHQFTLQVTFQAARVR